MIAIAFALIAAVLADVAPPKEPLPVNGHICPKELGIHTMSHETPATTNFFALDGTIYRFQVIGVVEWESVENKREMEDELSRPAATFLADGKRFYTRPTELFDSFHWHSEPIDCSEIPSGCDSDSNEVQTCYVAKAYDGVKYTPNSVRATVQYAVNMPGWNADFLCVPKFELNFTQPISIGRHRALRLSVTKVNGVKYEFSAPVKLEEDSGDVEIQRTGTTLGIKSDLDLVIAPLGDVLILEESDSYPTEFSYSLYRD